ncbi:hypothetical protein [Aeromonas sp. S9(2024)]|uniref:hypothetical protein n=1 Tax=Aeromonas sp. S9(2024) TaxID=3242882 RepID=UPI0035292A49
MTSPLIDHVSLFICDDIRKEANNKLSLLGIYLDKVISAPINVDKIIPSLCFVVSLTSAPGNYDISFEIIADGITPKIAFTSPKETLEIKGNDTNGMFAARLGNIKVLDDNISEHIFKLKVNKEEYSFRFKLVFS